MIDYKACIDLWGKKMNNKYPVGTILEQYDDGIRIILGYWRDGYVVGYNKNAKIGDAINNKLSTGMINDLVDNHEVKVILPYGYNTPLWRVLNGEEA